MKENYTINHSTRLKYIRLDMNENNWGPSPGILDVIHNLKSEDISVYPEKDKLLNMLARKLKIRVENILLGNGSDELIDLITRNYVTEDSHVILPIPTFSMFEICFDKKTSEVHKILYENNFSYPTENVIAAVKDQTSIIVAVSPNNPTGTILPRKQLIRIIESAPQATVILDEAYAEFAGESNLDLIKSYPNFIVLRTFSKGYGLAGLRLGYAVSDQKNIDLIKQYQMPFSINSIALKVAVATIKTTSLLSEMMRKANHEKQELISALHRLEFPVRETKANFVLVKTGLWTDEIYRALKRKGILVRNLRHYPLMETYLRITVGRTDENRKLIDALRTIISSKLIIFDMDGVLVDTRKSYDEAIKETVCCFTGKNISNNDILSLRDKGNYNNDWRLTRDLIRKSRREVTLEEVKVVFQKRLLGNDFNGLILKEEWRADRHLLKRLSCKYPLAIFTGRLRQEAMFTLDRNNVSGSFAMVITSDDLPEDRQKPDPKGIKCLLSEFSAEISIYIGDTVDDINAASAAGITSVLCARNMQDASNDLGARFTYNDINKIMELLL